MSTFLLLFLPIIIPVIGGLGLLIFNFKERKTRQGYVGAIVIGNMILALVTVFVCPKGQTVTLIHFTDTLSISLKIDGLGAFFGFILATLWVVSTFYSFEYMKHEGRENKFFAFFTLSFGVSLGLAFSANILTFYLFYELLTLGTLPLVMHGMDGKSKYAGKKYILYSIGGAAGAFAFMMFMYHFGTSLDFIYGGILDMAKVHGNETALLIVFVIAFFGFGVKAAVAPLSGWLPTAGVAPTPVSALLHAVAVVNAGIFAIIRVIYYSYGTSFLYGTWAQYTVMAAALVTILYGSAMALRTQHLKRRLAYSTVSNLSYMLFGITIMTSDGYVGGLTHMLFHSLVKITLFFCAGAIIYKSQKEYVYELNGFGRAMPITMATFTIASLALIGIPPLVGFTSKWNLATAAVGSGNPLAYVGIGVLIISALLTALYLMEIVVKAYFPNKDIDVKTLTKGVTDPNLYMTIPLILLTVVTVIVGIYNWPIMDFFHSIANGLL